jgi:hypothetical protein
MGQTEDLQSKAEQDNSNSRRSRIRRDRNNNINKKAITNSKNNNFNKKLRRRNRTNQTNPTPITLNPNQMKKQNSVKYFYKSNRSHLNLFSNQIKQIKINK